MERSYERIIQLMGKKTDDPLFTTFVEDLGDLPVVFLDNSASTEYQFPNSGLELSFMKGPNCITYAFLHFCSPRSSPRTRWNQYYEGDLPAGVTAVDSLSDIRKKLGIEPIASNAADPEPANAVLLEEYVLSTIKLRWHFSILQRRLSMLSLCYIPANDWIKAHGTGYKPLE